MDKVPTSAVDNFLTNWNSLFPDMPLALANLKRPHAVMMALFHLTDRLGVSRDAVLMAPEDPDEHTGYYRDLLPLINMTRIFNHLASVLPEANLVIPMMSLLQPNANNSYTVLMVLFNLMLFNESRLEEITPSEVELFSQQDEVKNLIEKKANLIQMRNTEAVEKGNRAECLEQLEQDIPQLEEELKQEKEIEAEVLQQLEATEEENRQTDLLLEQKKAHRDATLAENARKKALRVHDAEDVKGQVEQAAQNVREAEEELSALSATLTQKESSLNTLQTLKPILDQTNTLLHDIMKVAESIKDFENGDLETDSAEGELAVLDTERGELDAALGEARAAARGAAARRRARAAARQHAHDNTHAALCEAEEKHKREAEAAERAAQETRIIKEATARYEQEKAEGVTELASIKDNFVHTLTAMENDLLDKVKDSCRRLEEQYQRRRNL